MSGVPAPDDAAHQDNVLVAQVGKLNEQLGRYVLRFLAADALAAEPVSTNDERALAERVAAVAHGLQARADRRERDGEPPPLIGPCAARNTATLPGRR